MSDDRIEVWVVDGDNGRWVGAELKGFEVHPVSKLAFAKAVPDNDYSPSLYPPGLWRWRRAKGEKRRGLVDKYRGPVRPPAKNLWHGA